MDKDATIIIHGFLSVPNLEKLQIVNAINEYSIRRIANRYEPNTISGLSNLM